MKKIFILISLIFINFSVFAENIEDFEVGPISVGQSLFEYTEKNEIDFLLSEDQYNNDKYIRYEISKVVNVEGYDFVDVMVKKNDPNYIIEAISAGINYNELPECLSIKADIQKGVEEVLKPDDKQDTEFPSKQDKTGESMIYGVQYYTKPYPSNESIIVNCYHMTEKSNLTRVLRLSVNTHDFTQFIVNEAHN